MEINKSIFKSLDVRGIYPGQLNEESAYQIGRAFIKYTGAKKVVVGYDARVSSPNLFKALTQGLFTGGADVYSIGQVPTECLYFAVGFYDFDAGIMITASHNPKEYNGLKMMQKKKDSISWIRGDDLLPIINESKLSGQVTQAGKINNKNIWKDYVNHISSFTLKKDIKPFKIVIDASNGVAGLAIKKIKSKLPVTITALNFKPDGNFPNHAPNPLEEGSVNQINAKIKKEKADFGFIFDGDGDRVFLVDNYGNLVKADVTLLLLAKYFLQKNPGMAIAYNAICSRAVPEFIKKWGGVPIRTKVGFVNVREGVLQNNGIMGGELSGHYSFKDYFYMDSGVIAFLTLLKIISQDKRKISEIVKELSPYAKSSEINFKVANKDEILHKIKEKYSDLPAPRPNIFYVYAIMCEDGSLYIGQTQDLKKRFEDHQAGNGADWAKGHKPLYVAHYEEYPNRGEAVKREQDLKTGFGRKWLQREIKAGRARQAGGKQDYLDGVTVEYKDWWFNARLSNTEPLLRLTIEADTQNLLHEKEKELSEFITVNYKMSIS